jgi:plastocyanin
LKYGRASFGTVFEVHRLRMDRLLPLSLSLLCSFGCVGQLESGGPVGGDPENPGGSQGVDAGSSSGSADADPADPSSVALSIDPAASTIDLGQSATFTATLSSTGFAGPATVELTGASADWVVNIQPAQVQLTPGGSAQVSVTIDVPTNSLAGVAALQLSASTDLGSEQASASLTVQNQVTVNIAAGSGGGNHGLPSSISLRNGTPLVIVNADGTTHQIHAPDPYHSGAIGSAQSYTVNFAPGSREIYCHIHGAGSGVTSVGVSAD